MRILLASDDLTITTPGMPDANRWPAPTCTAHHTDAFYMLEGELTFQIGRESKTVTVSAGCLVAVPPGVVHSFRTPR